MHLNMKKITKNSKNRYRDEKEFLYEIFDITTRVEYRENIQTKNGFYYEKIIPVKLLIHW